MTRGLLTLLLGAALAQAAPGAAQGQSQRMSLPPSGWVPLCDRSVEARVTGWTTLPGEAVQARYLVDLRFIGSTPLRVQVVAQ